MIDITLKCKEKTYVNVDSFHHYLRWFLALKCIFALVSYGTIFRWGVSFVLQSKKKKMLLSPKLDILQKHVGCYTTIATTINVVIIDWFYNKDAFHNKKQKDLYKWRQLVSP